MCACVRAQHKPNRQSQGQTRHEFAQTMGFVHPIRGNHFTICTPSHKKAMGFTHHCGKLLYKILLQNTVKKGNGLHSPSEETTPIYKRLKGGAGPRQRVDIGSKPARDIYELQHASHKPIQAALPPKTTSNKSMGTFIGVGSAFAVKKWLRGWSRCVNAGQQCINAAPTLSIYPANLEEEQREERHCHFQPPR
jgi:hypothetical protein